MGPDDEQVSLKRPWPDESVLVEGDDKRLRGEDIVQQKAAQQEQSVPKGQTEEQSAPEQITTKQEQSAPKQESKMATNNVEPLAFISEKRSHKEYKADLKMWSRLTTLDKKV